MATTIVDADVKALISTTRDTTPFIDVADCVVSEVVGQPDPDSNPDNQSSAVGLSQRRLNAITKYLAAHFVYVSEANGVISARVGGVGEDYYSRYASKADGFGTTQFGKIACQLDTSGRLASISSNNGMKARFGVIQQRQDLPPDFWLFGWF